MAYFMKYMIYDAVRALAARGGYKSIHGQVEAYTGTARARARARSVNSFGEYYSGIVENPTWGALIRALVHGRKLLGPAARF